MRLADHPALADDRRFFKHNPNRRFRARAFAEGESIVPLFTTDEHGDLGEINLTIVTRIKNGRVRYFFKTVSAEHLHSDSAIKRFLRSRDIKPFMLGREQRRAVVLKF